MKNAKKSYQRSSDRESHSRGGKALTSLRAASWDEFHGQKETQGNALDFDHRCQKTEKSHWSTSSSEVTPGLGKTTMAHLGGRELGNKRSGHKRSGHHRAGRRFSINPHEPRTACAFYREIHRLIKW